MYHLHFILPPKDLIALFLFIFGRPVCWRSSPEARICVVPQLFETCRGERVGGACTGIAAPLTPNSKRGRQPKIDERLRGLVGRMSLGKYWRVLLNGWIWSTRTNVARGCVQACESPGCLNSVFPFLEALVCELGLLQVEYQSHRFRYIG
jgi:hypothetical protein